MKIEILNWTKQPLSTIGTNASYCYNTTLKDDEHRKRIGKSVIEDGHGRNLEFADVTLHISGVSAKLVREFYTHIGGMPTRVQASTRYITYKDFGFVIPTGMTNEQQAVYEDIMRCIQDGYGKLKELNCNNDITGYTLPLSMETEFIWKGNVRCLEHMFNQRLCKRALTEYQDLMKLLKKQLSELDEEWKWISDNLFVPKCIKEGFCRESRCCGMMPKKEEVKRQLQLIKEI